MNKKTFISHEPHDEDAWECLCGNTPDNEGFYACTRDGYAVDPTPKLWKENLYMCFSCGRVIDMYSLEVVNKVKLTEARMQIG